MTCIFTFVESVMVFVAYTISVNLTDHLTRKIGFTKLFNNGETEAVGNEQRLQKMKLRLQGKTSDRAGTGTQGQPWFDKVLSNIP